MILSYRHNDRISAAVSGADIAGTLGGCTAQYDTVVGGNYSDGQNYCFDSYSIDTVMVNESQSVGVDCLALICGDGFWLHLVCNIRVIIIT